MAYNKILSKRLKVDTWRRTKDFFRAEQKPIKAVKIFDVV